MFLPKNPPYHLHFLEMKTLLYERVLFLTYWMDIGALCRTNDVMLGSVDRKEPSNFRKVYLYSGSTHLPRSKGVRPFQCIYVMYLMINYKSLHSKVLDHQQNHRIFSQGKFDGNQFRKLRRFPIESILFCVTVTYIVL